MRSSRRRRLSRGFSLLEMVVALAVLAMSLAVLYQAAGGATRNVRSDERHAYAVELARSLLADRAMVPQSGLGEAGETAGGFSWRVTTYPVDLRRSAIPVGSLHQIEVAVRWRDGTRWREVVLNSVVEGLSP